MWTPSYDKKNTGLRPVRFLCRYLSEIGTESVVFSFFPLINNIDVVRPGQRDVRVSDLYANTEPAENALAMLTRRSAVGVCMYEVYVCRVVPNVHSRCCLMHKIPLFSVTDKQGGEEPFLSIAKYVHHIGNAFDELCVPFL